MVKLVIIDDEYEHVQGIRNFIPWDKYDIEVCGVAYNGRDGLELFSRVNPDIALIDIQMPFINGLTLIEEVNKLKQNVQMIIMSGHDDFSYARKAIELKANTYLLKPCLAEEILQAVLKAKNIILEENSKKLKLSQFESVFEQYITLFRERLLINLLDNKLRNPSAFYEDAGRYHIHLLNETCCAAVFRLEEKETLYAQSTNKEIDCLIISITEKIKAANAAANHFELVVKDGDLILIASSASFDFNRFLNLIHHVYNELSESFEYPFVVGVGQAVSSPLEVYKSYNQGLAALENSFLCEKKVIVYDDRIFAESFRYLYPFKEEKELLHAIEAGEQSLIREAIDKFFLGFEQEQSINNNTIKKVGISLLSSIMKFCSEKNIDTVELQQLIFKSFDDIISAKSLEALKAKINKIIEDIMNQIRSNTPVNKLIQCALGYIHSNFTKDISLKNAADELLISPAYLSFLFKQEMKTNFVDYLNNYRIIAAKELLKDFRLKSYEIAYQIGFQDEKYFFKLFKKYTGLTPSQYRETLGVFDIK